MQWFTAAVCLAGMASAFPSFKGMDPEAMILERQNDPFPFIPPQPGAVRSPCRGHNTLANHGYINRNGKGLTMQMVLNGFSQAMNFDPEGLRGGVQNALNLCSSETGTTCTAYNLDQLSQPHVIEHDGSLTAVDKQMKYNLNANQQAFNATVFGETMALLRETPCGGAGAHVGTRCANTVRMKRWNQAQQQDAPGWAKFNDGGSSTEHSFLINVFNDFSLSGARTNPLARNDWWAYLLENQRLPTAQGWKKPPVPITSAAIVSVAQAVRAAPTFNIALKRDLGEQYVGKHIEARGVIPFTDIPTLLATANPVVQSAFSAAAAAASAKVTPAPELPNPYFDVLAPADIKAQITAVSNQITSYQSVFQTELQNRLPQVTLVPNA